MLRLIDVTDLKYGFFTLFEKNNVPWLPAGSGATIDYDYYFNNSGQKPISPLLSSSIDDGRITQAAMERACAIAKFKYLNQWNRLYETMVIEYNPLENYKTTEHTSQKRENTKTSKGTEANSSTDTNTGTNTRKDGLKGKDIIDGSSSRTDSVSKEEVVAGTSTRNDTTNRSEVLDNDSTRKDTTNNELIVDGSVTSNGTNDNSTTRCEFK